MEGDFAQWDVSSGSGIAGISGTNFPSYPQLETSDNSVASVGTEYTASYLSDVEGIPPSQSAVVKEESASDLEHSNHDDVDAGEDRNQEGQTGRKHGLSATESGAVLRKACDLCTKMGVMNQCVYSIRQKSGRKKKVRGRPQGWGSGDHSPCLGWGGGGVSSVDPSIGRFSPSAAMGLVGHAESYFLARYLRDFNRFVPLTTEGSVTEGMVEVLSRDVVRGYADPDPIRQPQTRKQAKLAVFWGVVAMGSRIMGATDETTARYLELMRAALKECFDSNDKEVVQAYLLLSTVETMRGHEATAMRYLDFAQTMQNALRMSFPPGDGCGTQGGEGEQGGGGGGLPYHEGEDESVHMVFELYNRFVGGGGERGGCSSSIGPLVSPEVQRLVNQALGEVGGGGCGEGGYKRPRALDALKMLSNVCGLSAEVFDPNHKCKTVRQYLEEMDRGLKGADSVFNWTNLSECITGIVTVKLWGGVTMVTKACGLMTWDVSAGLDQVEAGIGYALTRPGLMTFPLWWHALHCAAIVLHHYGRHDVYQRLRSTYNKRCVYYA
ncbi:unnamed protein product [Discosporangium mesarthrocarpum]